MSLSHGRKVSIILILTVLAMCSVPMSVARQKRQSEKETRKMQELNALLEWAKLLDEKTYPDGPEGRVKSNNDYLAFREDVELWGRKYKVPFVLMIEHRPFRSPPRGWSTFKYAIKFQGMDCLLWGFELSHSLFWGHYRCIPRRCLVNPDA